MLCVDNVWLNDRIKITPQAQQSGTECFKVLIPLQAKKEIGVNQAVHIIQNRTRSINTITKQSRLKNLRVLLFSHNFKFL